MKRNLSFLLLLILPVLVNAQGVSKLFGLIGGYAQSNQTSNGFLFSTDSTGQNLQVKYDFPVTVFGALPGNLEMMPYNGKLYGTTTRGGVNDYGTIFEFDPLTKIYTKKFDFGPVAATGGTPRGSLLMYNGRFYGLAADNGVNGSGVLFEWDPATNVYTKKFDFTGNGGSYPGASPQNSLRFANGKMYGTTNGGGASGIGTVFEWDPVTNTSRSIVELNVTNGWGFYNNVTCYNNKVYVTSTRGGTNDFGTLLMIDPALPIGSNTTIIRHFGFADGAQGGNNEMIVYNNKLYGCMTSYGSNFAGTLFELDPMGNVFTKLAEFTGAGTGSSPQGKLVAYGTKFLGLCSSGGVNNTGTVFEWDPANPSVIVRKQSFPANNYNDPTNPNGTLTFFNNKFYSTNYNASFVLQGAMFEFDPSNNSITKTLSFNAAENGRIPHGRPVLLNGKIYGTCYQGPQEIFGTPYGCLWQFDPTTSVYSRKLLFSNENNAANGRAPNSSPIGLNSKLYGTTVNGGTSDVGVLYEFDPITDAYSKKDMQPIGGAYPIGEPTFYNGKLYGMTVAGGAGNNGIIYSYDIATSTLTKSLDVQTGGSHVPSGGFTVFNNKLYGVTSSGGANNTGGIIVYDPATNTVSNVASFSGSLGVTVSNAPTLYNDKFYLNAYAGGGNGRGAILKFDPADNSLVNIYSFSTLVGGAGYDPKGGLTVVANKLYLLSEETNNTIKVLELDPVTNNVAVKSSYAVNNYNIPVAHNGLTVVPAFIANGIAGSCEAYPVVTINVSNNNKWVPVLNAQGDVVAEIKANGNNLGLVTASMYINNGAVREDGKNQLYLDRNLTLTVQNPPASGVDIRLYIKNSEFNALKNATNSLGQPSGINTVNDIAIFKNDQACTAGFATTSVKQATVGSTYEYGYVLATTINSFSSFYFAKNSFVALPVSLVNFTAVKKSSKVELNWTTANELNLSRFEVEKSRDAINFSALTMVAAANQSTQGDYRTEDMAPVKGFNYYRLKLLDLDGTFTYSRIEKVNYTENTGLMVWPNPATTSLTIPEAKQNDRVIIMDAKGAVVLKQVIYRQNENINVNHLSNGIYMLQLVSEGNVRNSRFLKQ